MMAEKSGETFILTVAASLVAGEAHGPVELTLGFKISQTV